MAGKRIWQEPVVRSIDQLPPAYGDCVTGNTPVTNGVKNCANGGGASSAGSSCTAGNGAKGLCNAGAGT